MLLGERVVEQPTTNRMRDAFLSICQSFHMPAPAPPANSCAPINLMKGPSLPTRPGMFGRDPAAPSSAPWGEGEASWQDASPPPQHPQHVQEGCRWLLPLSHQWGGQMEELGVPTASFPN